ncbi:hypothetical protein [Pedobacter zeae]|uniref:Lipoprotein n=1 Tax=Pedobacter zeae TaxID=1737356 RepID=A0A7W6P8X4_9SPHI|nr:hypothetical protein [Pedobacter zeae]MBB4110439.1 hypothetical protein [Pedobacter zeae]GGH17901.1 hypothetical protein GCM10007422_41740 [Pedobacter zeae]
MKFPQLAGTILLGFAAISLFANCNSDGKGKSGIGKIFSSDTTKKKTDSAANVMKPVDPKLYDSLVKKLANGDTTGKWPVKKQPYPLAGAILPFKRIVVYYGNLHSKKMGALGEYAPKEMWQRLNAEVKHWEKADPTTPVQAGLHYIAAVASGTPGKDGKYINRMGDKQIDSVLKIAKMQPNTIVFLDLQVALSTIKAELPRIEKYLELPYVHLGIDPEFSMKDGSLPGKKIGTYDAADVNYVTQYLADIVKKHNLPPKVFVLHRFTKKMVTNAANIKLRPEVQVVVHMDGWGEPELKKGTYRHFVQGEPVQFTGFKLFYKNDLKKEPKRLMTPEELLKLTPKPIYIQYQ